MIFMKLSESIGCKGTTEQHKLVGWWSDFIYFFPHRSGVCHLTPEHSISLWLHQRTSGHHSARVRNKRTHRKFLTPTTTSALFYFIFFSLQTNYTEDSLTWDFMARRELEAPGAGEELHSAKGRASDINRREERCCQVYEEGVKSLKTGRSSENTHMLTFIKSVSNHLTFILIFITATFISVEQRIRKMNIHELNGLQKFKELLKKSQH